MLLTPTKRRVILVILLVALFLIIFIPQPVGQSNENMLVHFLAVGQGDAIFIETPRGVQLLIDAGQGKSILEELGEVMSPFDKTIDVVLMTHPDNDHIGGLDEVFSRFAVDLLISTGAEEGVMSERLVGALAAEEQLVHRKLAAGSEIKLDTDTFLQILSPQYDPAFMERNAGSLVVRLIYKDTAFLLTGDTTVAMENILVDQWGEGYLRSDVLKLGHHGSDTSTGARLLEATQADFAVISAGLDNQYGHPHVDVLERVVEYGMFPRSTAYGRVSFVSDGQTVRMLY